MYKGINTDNWKVQFIREQIDEPTYILVVDKHASDILVEHYNAQPEQEIYVIDDSNIEDFLCYCFGEEGEYMFNAIDDFFCRFLDYEDKYGEIMFDEVIKNQRSSGGNLKRDWEMMIEAKREKEEGRKRIKVIQRDQICLKH